MEFKKTVDFAPAYDKTSSDPAKNYGIGAMKIRFVLQGELGAVQFLIGTDWYLPKNQTDIKRKGVGYDTVQPQGWDIGYHSYKPMYEGQETITDKCDILDCPCYYDGSSLQAYDFIPEFLAGGSDAVWDMLEKKYRDVFCLGLEYESSAV